MKWLWVALASVMVAGCAVVPVPAPWGYASPGVSVDVGVPVYRGGYRHYPYRRYPYRHGYPYGYWR